MDLTKLGVSVLKNYKDGYSTSRLSVEMLWLRSTLGSKSFYLIRSMNNFFIPYLSFWIKLILKKHKPMIIGVTGTAGKTTVTQMLGHVLMQDSARPYVGVVGKTYGNKNADFGLRISILGRLQVKRKIQLIMLLPVVSLRQVFSSKYPKVLVLEYGTSAKGHIHDLVKFAPPQIGIVTNIGPAHLERHKTVEGVYMEKRALVQAVPPDGLVVLGSGHDFVSRLEKDSKAPVIILGGRGIELAEQITRAVSKHLDLPDNVISEGLNSFVPPKERLNRFNTHGILIIDDTYNANPLSMKLGLDNLAKEKVTNGRKVAILGYMAELGDLSPQYHNEVGLYAKKTADLVIGVGKGAEHYNPDKFFTDSTACAEHILSILKKNDIVFLKGSNSSKMKIIVDHLKEM